MSSTDGNQGLNPEQSNNTMDLDANAEGVDKTQPRDGNLCGSGTGTPQNVLKKRKPESSPSSLLRQDKELEEIAAVGTRVEIIDAVKTISEAIGQLHKEIVEYKSTKGSIREKSEQLQDLNKKICDLVSQNVAVLPDQEKNMEVIEEQEKPPTSKRNKLEPLRRAKYFCDRCSQELDQEEEERKEIRSNLKSALEYGTQEYMEFINKEWPEKTYEKTKDVVGNPLYTKEGDILIFLKEKSEDSTLVNLVKTRYPEIEDILSEENEDSMPSLNYLECTVSSKKSISKRRIHVIETKEEKDIRNIMIKLRDEQWLKDVKKLTVAVSNTELKNFVRKTLEIAFAVEEVEIDFFIQKRDAINIRDLSVDRRGRDKPEGVVIKTNVSTYADTLKNIRAVINPAELGVGIKAVKIMKNNNVVIETEKGKAETLHREIAAKISSVETRVTGNNTNILIFDIDASINGKEIEEHIRKETREYETVVKHVRTSRAGTQIATVSMPKRAAEALISGGDIRIGWTRCRVQLKYDVIRCYNCLNLGHHSDICREPKTEKRCLKCTQTGHLSRDCTNSSFCTVCDKTGHRSDSPSCPSFRKMIEEATRKNITEKIEERKNKTYETETMDTESSETKDEKNEEEVIELENEDDKQEPK